MIREWHLENFKSAARPTTLPFSPLTIFAGANSAGKSTIIQSILLTAQTLQSQVHSRSVVLNGHILRLGSFKDILSQPANSPNISLHFRLSFAEGMNPSFAYRYRNDPTFTSKHLRCQFTFGGGSEDGRDTQPVLQSSQVQLLLETSTTPEQSFDIQRLPAGAQTSIDKYNLRDDVFFRDDFGALAFEPTYKAAENTNLIARHWLLTETAKPLGVSLKHFLPRYLILAYDHIDEECQQIFNSIFDFAGIRAVQRLSPADLAPHLADEALRKVLIRIFEDSYEDWVKTDAARSIALRVFTQRVGAALNQLKLNFNVENLRGFLNPQVITSPLRRVLEQKLSEQKEQLIHLLRKDRPVEWRLQRSPLPDTVEYVAESVQRYFTERVRYLGPLRDEPKPVYPLAGNTEPSDVGFKGENTAAVLELHRYSQINYIPTEIFAQSRLTPSPTSATLETAVADWLDYMGIATKHQTQDLGTLGHALKVAPSEFEELHDLTHVGVGVSQVLPLLVASLISEPGSTLIFEQPELHLHPRVQSRLADFFISMCWLGKQCIVETHSEYLVNRLRVLSALSKSAKFTELVQIYFVTRTRVGSDYQPLRINEFGVIKNWPDGFFDESEHLARTLIDLSLTHKGLKPPKTD
jgi:predicted ATPase